MEIAMFRACSRDAVKERLRRMLDWFLQHNGDDADNRKTKAERCCSQAEVWYYKILESLIQKERKRLGTTAVPSLLENNLLQCCLVTCCLEITICLNHLPSDFRQLLQIYDLPPYHFCRVIELIVLRAEMELPDEVVRHLNQLDQEILASLAWTSDSALWDDIRANQGHLPTCQQVFPPTQLEVPGTTEANNDRNPPGAVAGLATHIPMSMSGSPSPAGSPRRSRPLHLFARKVYSLMGKRLRELCFELNVGVDLRWRIWTCFEHSLVHCTHLVMDRHLDQMLMCAVYVTAKVTEMEISFKHIRRCYESQPCADKTVCKNVLISASHGANSPLQSHNGGGPAPSQQQRGDLIRFYNQVYTVRMQSFAKLFAPTSGGDTPLLSLYPLRGRRLAGSRSIFISLYRPTATTPHSTPGLSYVFSSSLSERLHEINNMVRAGGLTQRRSHAAREDDGLSAKRPR